jgi:hypothetical protein
MTDQRMQHPFNNNNIDTKTNTNNHMEKVKKSELDYLSYNKRNRGPH